MSKRLFYTVYVTDPWEAGEGTQGHSGRQWYGRGQVFTLWPWKGRGVCRLLGPWHW